jgi:hypothetical protein
MVVLVVNLSSLLRQLKLKVPESSKDREEAALISSLNSAHATSDKLDALASLLLGHARVFAELSVARPLLIELVGRNLLRLSSPSSIDIPSFLKHLLNALACLIHSTPQLER